MSWRDLARGWHQSVHQCTDGFRKWVLIPLVRMRRGQCFTSLDKPFRAHRVAYGTSAALFSLSYPSRVRIVMLSSSDDGTHHDSFDARLARFEFHHRVPSGAFGPVQGDLLALDLGERVRCPRSVLSRASVDAHDVRAPPLGLVPLPRSRLTAALVSTPPSARPAWAGWTQPAPMILDTPLLDLRVGGVCTGSACARGCATRFMPAWRAVLPVLGACLRSGARPWAASLGTVPPASSPAGAARRAGERTHVV